MKKLFLNVLTCLAIFFSGSQSIFSQWSDNWKWSMGTPWGDDTRYIQMITATEWIGLGYNAGMIKTTDAGNTWTTRSDVSGYTGWDHPNIRGGYFFDSNTGFAIGDQSLSTGLISRTADGGNTWSNFYIPSTVINGINFLDNNVGYAVGNLGIAYKTINAGVNWTALTTGSTLHLNAVFALDSNNVYGVGQTGRFFKSTDGGNVWTVSPTSLTGTLYSVYFKNSDTGFVGGSSGSFQITTNGGASWTSRPGPVTTSLTKELHFYDPVILAVGDSRRLFRTTNYGVSWDTLNFSYSAPAGNITNVIYSLSKIGNDIVISGFSGLIYKSADNGNTWTTLTKIPTTSALQGFYASSMSGKMWAVGAQSPTSVLYSSNGGATWIPDYGGARYGDYRDIKFIDDNVGYICGSSGRILRTSTGGLSWDSLAPLTTQAANTIQIVDNDVVLVGCNGGRLLRSTNAGLNFTLSMIGAASQQITEFSFTDENTGFAVMSRDIIKTTDKGATWSTLFTHSISLLSISMADANTGYASGNAGSILKTTNSGVNWTPQSSPIPNNLTRVDFCDVNNGLVVSGGGIGINGSIMKTTNGGTSWNIANAGTNPLFNVKMFSPDSAIAIGTANIVKYMAPSSGYTLSLKINFELCPNKDTVTVELRSNTAPYNLIESKKGLGGQGVPALFNFAAVTNGTPYYIAVSNRNAITTWSSGPVSFTGNSLSYDFTSSASQAYGNNMKNAAGLWSFYQGDVNQDSEVNLTDMLNVYNDGSNYVTGPYVITDLNCDGFVDLTDLIPAYNNSTNFIKVEKP